VALPGSVPFILAGLRLGVGHALIGVVVGELVAAQAGVGLMMARAGATFQTSKVFAGLIIVAGTGIVLTGILQRSSAGSRPGNLKTTRSLPHSEFERNRLHCGRLVRRRRA
jgi:ABC-type nitrate/sulfonate/bicarbonate transport system permease component